MTIVSTAPGKVVLLGEYAVLEGAPALVVAVDRKVRVEAHPGVGGCSVSNPAANDGPVPFDVRPDGGIRWGGNRDAASTYALLQPVFTSLHEHAVVDFDACVAFRIDLDSRALFQNETARDETSPTHKLGLGSSAALTVALAHALHALGGGPELDVARWLPVLLEAHRRFQEEQGSGVDIAASLYGGTIAYSLSNNRSQVGRVELPEDLQWAFIWSGRSTSTARLLQGLRSWRHDHSRDYDGIMDRLALGAASGTEALKRGKCDEFLHAVELFSGELAALGRRAGLEIVGSEHIELSALAKRCGLVYKPCGAGGGDLGVAMGTDADRTVYFADMAAGSGYQPIDISVSPIGVQTTRS